MTVTKDELSETLSEAIGLNKREANEFVDAFFEEIRSQLEAGTDVKRSGFGNFVLRTKNHRPGRNPKTGRGFLISARPVVVFHPGVKLKFRVRAPE